MKKSHAVALSLVGLGVAVAGLSAGNGRRDDPECVNQQTGEVVHTSQCQSAYNAGRIGSGYGLRYRNGDGSFSTVDAGNRTLVGQRGGFGSGGYASSGSHSSGFHSSGHSSGS